MVKPRINRFAAGLIVVVIEVESDGAKLLRRMIEIVNVLNRRTFDGQSHFGPITRGSDQDLRARHGGGSDFHIRVLNAQTGRVFTTAAALHRVRDHYDRCLRGKAIVHRAKHEGLCAAARFTGASQPPGVHIRQRGEEIKGANAVPGLQAHQADVPELVGPIRAKLAMNVVVRLVCLRSAHSRVVVSYHVESERDHSLAGKVDAASGVTAVLRILEATGLPMSVWIENSREGSFAAAQRAIEISAEIKSRQRLNVHLLDAVAVAFDLA